MKIKKLAALALAAVMAASVLTACGGGSGASGSVSTSQVNGYLDDVGSDINVTTDSSLNNAVRTAASNISAGGSISAAYSTVSSKMNWSVESNFIGAIRKYIASDGLTGLNMSYGSVQVVESEDLQRGVSMGILGAMGTNGDKIAKLGELNTPEKVSAAMILKIDGMIGTLSDMSNNLVRFTYNASATKAKTQDGTVYWVFATQVNVHAL